MSTFSNIQLIEHIVLKHSARKAKGGCGWPSLLLGMGPHAVMEIFFLAFCWF